MFHAGKVLPLNTKTIPDYAVMPILGHEVKMMVREVITHAWVVSMEKRSLCLQLCIKVIDSNVKKFGSITRTLIKSH